ncbi:MAG: hypothetical protein P8X57_02860, partial [Cyclobacteriaceae bacterium]
MKYVKFALVCFILLTGCSQPETKKEILIENIRKTEEQFALMARQEGLREAFTAFAHPDAVLNRGELIKGKDAINTYYSDPAFSSVTLQWQPSFIDVSASGDLAYTYGPY